MSRRVSILGEALLAVLHRRGWVTWERESAHARLLMVTNAWPTDENPALGIFLRHTVDGLDRRDMRSDVLFVRGYRGAHCYLAAAVLLALLPLIRPGKYRLVHSHGGEVAPFARCFWGAPVLASYWGSDILGPLTGNWRHRLKLLVASRGLRAGALLMTATATKTREMADCLPARARIRNWIIPDGIDRERFAPGERLGARQRLGWPAEGVVIVSVGRPIALKRTWLAQQAAAVAARRVPGLTWRLVCDLEPELMPLVYNAADCLVHTSMSEGSPNVVKEALAANLPVVATAAGDIPELLDGVAPSAVCPADVDSLAEAIVACVDPPRRSNGRDRSQELGLEHTTDLTLRCYRSLAPDLLAGRASTAS